MGDKVAKRLRSSSPLGRIATPQEVAYAAVFLAGDESSGMTGQALNVTTGSEVR